MEFAQPPPNLAMPPPNLVVPNQQQGYMNRQPFRPFMNMMKPLPGPLGNMTLEDFDGKRLRKSVMRKTVDYNSAIIKELENRVWQRDYRDRRALQPDAMYYPDMMPPPSYQDNPINCVTTRFVKTATNKMRCPIFCMAWTPEGRRLVTGASSGEFTLWNGLTFNFETILQAHDSPVRTMVWSHNDSWMITGDHAGYVKYWQSNMNNVKMFQAHKEALRGISFSPSDAKFVTCSDDGTLRIWDFFRYQEERILRGHGADVKCCHWHPQKGLIISGSKDNQQPIKLWDPKTGQSLATLHAHKSTVMDLKWNDNGNWLITASRDHLLKLFDLRNLSQEVQTFRGHKKEASSVAWHPVHEGLFCSGGSDGAIMFWHVGADKEVGAIEQAHDSIVWTLAWHPLGHILCSGSNDHSSKFWTRNRPGDQMKDKYNLNTLPAGIAGLEDLDMIGDENVGAASVIPGMGPEDKVEITSVLTDENQTIPGLDLDVVNDEKPKPKKVPFSKPIPRNFQAQWNETANDDPTGLTEVINQIVENTPGVVPLQQIAPNAIIIYGKLIPVESGSKLEQAIADGPEALSKYIASGEIEELHDVMPINDDDEGDYLQDDIDDIYNNGNSNNGPLNTSSNNAGDTDLRSANDQDMRFNSMGDVDFRKDVDFRGSKSDGDFRGDIDFRNQNHRDFDMRNKMHAPQAMDEDFRNYNEEYGDGYNHDNYNENYEDYDEYGDDDYRNNRRYEDEDYSEDFYEDGPPGPNNWHRNNQKFNDYRGGRNSQPYNSGFRGRNQGGSSRDGSHRDGSHRDGSHRDGSHREGTHRDGNHRDGGSSGGNSSWNRSQSQNDFRGGGRGNRKGGRGSIRGGPPRGGRIGGSRGGGGRGKKLTKRRIGGLLNDGDSVDYFD